MRNNQFWLALASAFALSACIPNHPAMVPAIGYPIQAITAQWGEPDDSGPYLLASNGKWRRWESCGDSDYVRTTCQYGNCVSYRVQACCHQTFFTSNDIIIKGRVRTFEPGGMSEGITASCYSLNQNVLRRFKREAVE